MNEVEYILRVVLKARDEMAKTFAGARAQVAAFATSARGADADITNLNKKITSLNTRLKNTVDRLDSAGQAFKRFASTKRDADGDIERNVNLFERLAGSVGKIERALRDSDKSIDRNATKQRNLGSSASNTSRDLDKVEGSLRRGDRAAGGYGGSLSALDNNLRGLALLAVFGSLQQLTTAFVSLGGELVSVAGSAVMAGGALGGSLTAGIIQALPMVGLLVAAFSRVQQVMQAVQLQQRLQQAQFTDSAKKGDNLAKTTDQVANAHDGLRDAIENVTKAQTDLDKARANGVRQLEDLVLAEQKAILASKGAALGQRDAQVALQQAIQTGGDVQGAQLEVQQSIVDRRGAGTDRRRATADRSQAAGSVENLPDVQNAERVLRDAQQAQTRAGRAMDEAKRTASEAGGSVATAAANLNFFLTKQLDDSERRLFDAVTRIQETYKKNFRPITDIIVDAFTRAVDRADKLLQMPKVLSTARKSATAISQSIGKVVDTVSSKPIVDQFLRIADAGRKNLGPVTDILITLGKAVLNIAEDAGPSLSKFIDFIGGLADKFLALTDNKDKVEGFFDTGEKHLEAWINLLVAVIGLFAALTGASAGEGLKSVEDATKAINGIADKIRSNGEGVRKFFQDARKDTDQVIRVIISLGKEIIKSFDPSHFKNLADILTNVVIPALGTVVRTTGQVTDIVSTLLDIPFVRDIAKWGLILTAFAFSATSVGKAATLAKTNIGLLFGNVGKAADALVGVRSKLLNVGPAITSLGTQMSGAAGTASMFEKVGLGPLAVKGEKVGGVLSKLGPIATRAGVMIGAAADFALGPWGLAIAAVILAIVLLDRKFHFLAPTFKWLKGAFGDVIDWLKTHWPLVLTILTGPLGLAVTIIAKNWDKISGAARDAFNTVRRIITGGYNWVVGKLHDLAHAVGSILPNPFRKAGKGAADGLVSGLKSVGDFFANIGKWLFNHVIKPIYDFFEIKSPSGLFKRIGIRLIDGLVEGFLTLPDALLSALDGMGDALMKVGTKLGEWLRKGIEKVPGGKLLLGATDKARDLIGKVFARGGPVPGSGSGDTVAAMLTPGEHVWTKGEVAAAGGHDMMYALRALFGGGRQSAGTAMAAGGAVAGAGSLVISFQGGSLDDFTSAWRAFWTDLRHTANTDANRIYFDIRGSLADIQNSFKVRGESIVKNWQNTWGDLDKTAYDGLFYIGHNTNRALSGLGEKTIDFGLTTPAIKRQRGGMIPGHGDGDKVPVLAESGEGFINKRAVRALGGPGVINAINAMIPRFQAGGVVDGNLFDGHPGNVTGGIRSLIELLKRHFPQLIVTSTTDHSVGTSTGGISDHPSGHAVDVSSSPSIMGRVVSWILSSGLWKRLKQGIHNPGLAVNRGEKVDGPGFFQQAWPQHVDHIHLALAGALGAVADVMAHIGKLTVKPGGGAMSNLVQAAINKVRGAANRKLAQSSISDDSSVSMGGGAAAERIFRYFRRRGFNDEQAAGWVGNFQQESGLNPKVVQPNGEGHGLAQWGGGRFAALQTFAKQNGKPWQDMQTQLDFVWHELQGTENSAYRGILGAKNLVDAVNAIGRLYERFGIQGDRSGPARSALAQFGGKFDVGGIVPGSSGSPVGILAHGGEWVLNPGQQIRAAMLSGLSVHGLRSMLGFHGGGGSFAGGGEVPAASLVGPISAADVKALDATRLRALFDILRNLLDKLANSTGLGNAAAFLRDIDKVDDDLTKGANAAKRSSRKDRSRSVNLFLDTVENLTGDSGLFTRLRTAIERRTNQATTALARARFSIGAGGVISERQGGTAQAQAALDEQRRQRGDLVGERDTIARQIAQVVNRQQRGGLTDAQKQRLQAQENKLRGLLDDANQRVADNVSAIFEAQQAVIQAQQDAVQKQVDTITKNADNTNSYNDVIKRIATLFGDQGTVARINAAQRQILSDEAKQLEAQISQAAAVGSTDLAAQLTIQVTDLRAQIQESLSQELTDAASAIQASGSRSQGRLDLFSRLLAATGTVGRTAAVAIGGQSLSASGIAAQQMTNTASQITATRDLLNRVLREQPQNTVLIQQLGDSIDDLNVTYQEQKRAEFQARVDNVNSTYSFSLGINDLNKQIIELTGQITGNTDVAGELALAQQAQALLVQKGNELQQLYNEAVSTGDIQAQQDLQTALLQNQVAILQNTQAINELNGAMTQPQSFTSSAWTLFREAVFSGMGRVLPQYSLAPIADTGGIAMRAGLYNLAPGELYVPKQWSDKGSGGDGDINIEINEAGRPIDTTEVTSAIAFARKTMQ